MSVHQGRHGAEVLVRVAEAEGIAAPNGGLYVEVAFHLDGSTEELAGGGEVRVTKSMSTAVWNETLRLPLASALQGHVKVSIRAGTPLPEQRMAELAFEGKQIPPPLGFVRVPVTDLPGLDRSRPLKLQGTATGVSASIVLGFTIEGPSTVIAAPPDTITESDMLSEESNSAEEPTPAEGARERRHFPRGKLALAVGEPPTLSPCQGEGGSSAGSSLSWTRSNSGRRTGDCGSPQRDDGDHTSEGSSARQHGRGHGKRTNTSENITSGSASEDHHSIRKEGEGDGDAPGKKLSPLRIHVQATDDVAQDAAPTPMGSGCGPDTNSWLAASSDGPASAGRDHEADGPAPSRPTAGDQESSASLSRGVSTDGSGDVDETGKDKVSPGRESLGSSSDYGYSSARPVLGVGDSSGGSRGVAKGEERRGVTMDVALGMRNARMLEALEATVAATVAEVAAETYSGGSGPEGFTARSSSEGESASTSADGAFDSLPLAGSKSPPQLARASDRRETPRGLESSAARRSSWRKRESAADSSSSDGYAGGLPLAGSKSPPRTPTRGRRSSEPSADAAGKSTTDSSGAFTGMLPLAGSKSPPQAQSPGQRESGREVDIPQLRLSRRRQAETGNGAHAQGRTRPATAAARSEDSEPSESTDSSASLDLHSYRTSGAAPNGTRGRPVDEQLINSPSRSRDPSINSWWNEGSSAADEASARVAGIAPPSRQKSALGTRGQVATSAPTVAASATPAARRVSPQTGADRPAIRRQQEIARHRVAAAAAGSPAPAPSKVPGLRPTHFAPGYVGVAWPKWDGRNPSPSAARAKLLARLEEAALRKLADVEEKARRAREDRVEKLKRRNMTVQQHAKRELKEALREQDRRLQRQLDAARRRQAGAEAAASVAAAAAASAATASASAMPAPAAPLAQAGAAGGGRAEAVRRRRAMVQAEEARAKVYALKQRGHARTQALLRAGVRGLSREEDIRAAAHAFEAAFDGRVFGGFRGKGIVLSGGSPRSTFESWEEQRRAKAEEERLHAAMEGALESLRDVATVRRQEAIIERRERARRSNARAQEIHGRAAKRAKMEAKIVAARLKARARGAEAVKQRVWRKATARSPNPDRVRQGRMGRAESGRNGRLSRRRKAVAGGGRGREGNEQGQGRRSNTLRVTSTARDVEGQVTHAKLDGSVAPDARAQAYRSRSRDSQLHELRDRPSFEKRKPQRAGETRVPTRSQANFEVPAQAQPSTVPVSEDHDMTRQLQHLNSVAARLEEAETGIEAKMEALFNDRRYGSTTVLDGGGIYGGAPGAGRAGEGFVYRESGDGEGGGGPGIRDPRQEKTRPKGSKLPSRHASDGQRLQRRVSTSSTKTPARRGVSRATDRPSSPTVSSNDKARSGLPARAKIASSTLSREDRRRLGADGTIADANRTSESRQDSSDDGIEGAEASETSSTRPLLAGAMANTAASSGARIGRSRSSVAAAAAEEMRTSASAESDDGSGTRRGKVPRHGHGNDDNASMRPGRETSLGERLERQGGNSDSSHAEIRERVRRRHRVTTHSMEDIGRKGLAEADFHGDERKDDGEQRGHLRYSAVLSEDGSLTKGQTRGGNHRSEGHKEMLEAVSSEASRMREIKDDLASVLERLRRGDFLPATDAEEPPATIEGGERENFRGSDRRPQDAESFQRRKGGATSSPSGPPAAAPSSASPQVSALADLEARISSLGGILDSYSSDSSFTPTRMPPSRSSRISSPASVQSPYPSQARALPLTPDVQVAHQYPDLLSDRSLEDASCHDSPSVDRSDHSTMTLGDASDLAREVEALLRTSGNASGGGVDDWNSPGRLSTAARGKEWAELEGMADRLGALTYGESASTGDKGLDSAQEYVRV